MLRTASHHTICQWPHLSPCSPDSLPWYVGRRLPAASARIIGPVSPSYLPYSLPVLSADHQEIQPPVVRDHASPSDVALHRNELRLRTVTVLPLYEPGADFNRQHRGLCVLDTPVHLARLRKTHPRRRQRLELPQSLEARRRCASRWAPK